MEHGSHFGDILDAYVAAASRVPMGEPPVLDARPDPAIRFAMWGGGVPLNGGGAAHAWGGVKVRGVSPWATDGYRTPATAGQAAERAERTGATTARHETVAHGDMHTESPPTLGADSATGTPPRAATAPSSGFAFRPRVRPAVPFESRDSKTAAPRIRRILTATDRAALDTLRKFGATWLGDSFTDEELKGAYRYLAFELHPDQHPEAGAAARIELGAQFSQVNAAYRRLTGR